MSQNDYLNQLKGNSHAEREKQKREVKKVINGGAVSRKQPAISKVADTFLADDLSNVKTYLIYDVLVPKIKDTIVDMFVDGIKMIFYGTVGGGKNSSNERTSYTSYYKYGNSSSSRSSRTLSSREETPDDYREIILETRTDAEEVLDTLDELISSYKYATVADLYTCVGITGDFTDNKFGWSDLKSARVRPTRGGYLLVLPRPTVLD